VNSLFFLSISSARQEAARLSLVDFPKLIIPRGKEFLILIC